MYVPSAFRLDDRAALLAHAAAHPFATVISFGSGTSRDTAWTTGGSEELSVSHLPLLVDPSRGVLRGHLARHNPQLAHLTAGTQVLAIFHGPHGYVSPSVYSEQPSVPTWNYVVVHAQGRGRLVDESALRTILDDMVTHFDTSGWRLSEDEEFLRGKLGAIAGFEIDLDRLEGKWKLSQNRSPADQAHVVDWLERGDDASRALARLMSSKLRSEGR